MMDDPCLRCGHERADHDADLGYCEQCQCEGFLAEDVLENAPDEVEELHLGNEE